MKTPRDLYLAKHQAADAKLDQIRAATISRLGTPVSAVKERPEAAPNASPWWITLLRPFRLHLAGLAAVWTAILAFNLTTPASPPNAFAAVKPTARELILALVQKHRLLAQLADFDPPSPAEPTKPTPDRPRGQLRIEMIVV